MPPEAKKASLHPEQSADGAAHRATAFARPVRLPERTDRRAPRRGGEEAAQGKIKGTDPSKCLPQNAAIAEEQE